jgi:hypothetical protein
MALTLISNPVVTEGGIVKNLFSGFEPVEFLFKREDLPIVSVDLGVDAFVRITISNNLTTYLSVGDSVYLYAEGLDGYIYDNVGEITAITATTIDCTINYMKAALKATRLSTRK